MNDTNYQTPFSTALLTSVFVGFVTTILCLAYNIIFREETGFDPSDFINVSSLIFAVNLLFLVIGFIYFPFSRSKRGDIIFIVLFALLTIIGVVLAERVNRSPNHEITLQFRTLLTGIVLIVGIAASFAIPFLFHNKRFRRDVI